MNLKRTTTSRFALALAVVFLGAFSAHAANPFNWSVGKVTHPNGIVATPAVFLVSSQDQVPVGGGNWNSLIYSLDAAGTVIGGPGVPFVTITKGIAHADNVQEVYLAAAPGTGGGWTAFDIYACRGNKVFHIPALGGTVDGAAPFVTLPGAGDRQHCGITFDRNGGVGGFGFDMIVTTEGDPKGTVGGVGGKVFRVTSGQVVSPLVTLPYVDAFNSSNVTEGPAVLPPGFFGAPGELMVTQEDNPGPPGVQGKLFHITSGGAAAVYTTFKQPESNHVVPPGVCDYSTTGGGFFTTDFNANTIIGYPAGDFVGLGGNLIVPIEFTTAGQNLFQINKTTGVATPFDGVAGNPAVIHEGSTFVECGPAKMPIIKHSTGGTQPTDADFIFGLYPTTAFTNPPTGTPFNYVVNVDNNPAICPPIPGFPGPAVRGTCIVTPPENNLPIDLSGGAFNAAVCELKHTAGWTFSSWTVGFTPNNIPLNFASAPYHPTGETTDAQIMCINLTIQPGTTEVDLNVFDTPPQQGQYCSPGYWKQPQHFGNYPGNVNPLSTLFTSIFTTGPVHNYDGLTFPQVIATGGGGWSMFGRVAAASYLDAKVLNFGMPATQVVTLANAAFASGSTGSAAFNTALNAFNALAIENCPLGRAPLPGSDENGQGHGH